MPSVAGLHETFKCFINHMIEMMAVTLVAYVVIMFTVAFGMAKNYCVTVNPLMNGMDMPLQPALHSLTLSNRNGVDSTRKFTHTFIASLRINSTSHKLKF